MAARNEVALCLSRLPEAYISPDVHGTIPIMCRELIDNYLTRDVCGKVALIQSVNMPRGLADEPPAVAVSYQF